MTRPIAFTMIVAAALALAACDEPTNRSNRANRIVCLEAGQVVYDDFSLRNTRLAEGGITYISRATGERSRVTGNCHAYMADVPAGWTPTLPAAPVR